MTSICIVLHTEPLFSVDVKKKSVLECVNGVIWQMHVRVVGLEMLISHCMLGIKLTDEGEWNDLNSRN